MIMIKKLLTVLVFLLYGKLVVANVDMRVEEVLSFWFDYTNHGQTLYTREIWWQKNEAFDNTIREEFSELRHDAIAGKLNKWLETPRGTLAYIILIDQFSRNLFRGTAQMYEHDNLALQAALNGIDKGFDQNLSLTERVFFNMPFEHSESLEFQKLSLKLFEKIVQVAPADVKSIAENYYNFAQDHYNIIKKFNRFPHRNKILKRKSTQAEEIFLKTHKGW
ncbi:MAG: DUF924 domain-containing protein [Proteobacteria bacterium]|nr:DUF924 domain-containing protein [Pseudomonadota bacterium]